MSCSKDITISKLPSSDDQPALESRGTVAPNPNEVTIAESFECLLSDVSFKVQAIEIGDEGYQKIQLISNGKKLIIQNSDGLVSGFASLEDGPCGKLPAYSLNSNTIILLTSIDNRPFGNKMMANFIDLKHFKIVDQLKLDGGKLYYFNSLFFS